MNIISSGNMFNAQSTSNGALKLVIHPLPNARTTLPQTQSDPPIIAQDT